MILLLPPTTIFVCPSFIVVCFLFFFCLSARSDRKWGAFVFLLVSILPMTASSQNITLENSGAGNIYATASTYLQELLQLNHPLQYPCINSHSNLHYFWMGIFYTPQPEISWRSINGIKKKIPCSCHTLAARLSINVVLPFGNYYPPSSVLNRPPSTNY